MKINATEVEPVRNANEVESGYRHSLYAKSLEEFGAPLYLPASDGWLLKRPIPGSDRFDAMGCYPLFACRDWRALSADLAGLEGEPVTVSLVSDPLAPVVEADLAAIFDVVIPFKRHFVTDLSIPREQAVSKHHRRWALKAIERVEVRVCEDPVEFVDTWTSLYSVLSDKHSIAGLRRFSRRTFEKQLQVPGTVILTAIDKGDIVGADWWFLQGDVVYGHLAAYNETGYRLRASYALLWAALDYFRGKAAWLHLGAGPGLSIDTRDGLSLFKMGWATGTRTAYLCGRILDRVEYEALAGQRIIETSYFPAYRAGEFG